MKTRVLAIFAILAVFGLAIAAYAYKLNTVGMSAEKASCCAKDSCPMMAAGEHKMSGEHAKMSCAMKHGDEKAQGQGNQSCECCGDSCPMKKDAAAAVAAVGSEADDGGCCESCTCCGGEGVKHSAGV